MPFVTESVWDALPASGLLSHDTEFLMISECPDPQKLASKLSGGEKVFVQVLKPHLPRTTFFLKIL